MEENTKKRNVRIVIKVVSVLFTTVLATIVFGLEIPFTLLAFELIPSLGVAGVIYVFVGGIIGLLLGGISTGISLYKTDKLISPYYLKFTLSMIIISLAYLLVYFLMYERFGSI